MTDKYSKWSPEIRDKCLLIESLTEQIAKEHSKPLTEAVDMAKMGRLHCERIKQRELLYRMLPEGAFINV